MLQMRTTSVCKTGINTDEIKQQLPFEGGYPYFNNVRYIIHANLLEVQSSGLAARRGMGSQLAFGETFASLVPSYFENT